MGDSGWTGEAECGKGERKLAHRCSFFFKNSLKTPPIVPERVPNKRTPTIFRGLKKKKGIERIERSLTSDG